MPDCGPPPRSWPAEVPRADVEHLIAVTLHATVCGQDYAEPEVAAGDRAGHAMGAQAICDALAGRGWTVNRRS